MLLVFILIFFLFVAVMVLFFIVSSFVGFLLTGVPFVRTSAQDIESAVKAVEISKKDIVFELGSGDGRAAFLIEKSSGAKVKGFELTWWAYYLACLIKIGKGSGAEFFNKNFFKVSWSEATVIYGYLYPPLMWRVEEKFLAECKPGSRAVIRDFPFPSLAYAKKLELPKGHELYIYVK